MLCVFANGLRRHLENTGGTDSRAQPNPTSTHHVTSSYREYRACEALGGGRDADTERGIADYRAGQRP
jgi:hypothetical protein